MRFNVGPGQFVNVRRNVDPDTLITLEITGPDGDAKANLSPDEVIDVVDALMDLRAHAVSMLSKRAS